MVTVVAVIAGPSQGASAGPKPGHCGHGACDKSAPTQPADLAVTGSSTTSVSLAWLPSTDNVGVSGYGVCLGGNVVATTQQTSHTFSSLTCGTSYDFAVDA